MIPHDLIRALNIEIHEGDSSQPRHLAALIDMALVPEDQRQAIAAHFAANVHPLLRDPELAADAGLVGRRERRRGPVRLRDQRHERLRGVHRQQLLRRLELTERDSTGAGGRPLREHRAGVRRRVQAGARFRSEGGPRASRRPGAAMRGRATRPGSPPPAPGG